jgi:hypothetical protein
MSLASYPAARLHAARIAEHFGRHTRVGPAPDAAAVEALIDAGFWASLLREEGYAPEISLAFLPPERAVRPLRLLEPLPLTPRALARLAPAVERPGIHLGVSREGGELRVWGTTLGVPSFCMVLEVLGPGLLVVKHRTHDDSAKFRNVAVFEGESLKLLQPEPEGLADAPALLRSLLRPEAARPPIEHDDVLLRLAVSMRAHKRGGTLLVVPAGSEAWRESIVRPIAYAVEPPFCELRDLLSDAATDDDPRELGRVVDEIAGLTAVDGATLITDRCELLAFGVKIGRPEGRPRVERVLLSEPVEAGRARVVAAQELGGTRHNSAAQFAQDQQAAFAMVASQDARFTALAWSERAGLVRAHRVEALLL